MESRNLPASITKLQVDSSTARPYGRFARNDTVRTAADGYSRRVRTAADGYSRRARAAADGYLKRVRTAADGYLRRVRTAADGYLRRVRTAADGYLRRVRTAADGYLRRAAMVSCARVSNASSSGARLAASSPYLRRSAQEMRASATAGFLGSSGPWL